MELPLVSIVVPCFNAARFVEQALDSCFAQTYPRCEVVAIDDGSTDDTRAQLRSYEARRGRALKVLEREHAGVSAARNAGIDAAAGTHLLFLDADDFLTRDAIANLVAGLQATGADNVVGNWCTFTQGTGHREVYSGKPRYPDDGYASCVRGLWFNGAILVRRTSVRWNEGRQVWEALEYMLGCLMRSRSLAYVDEVVIDVRQHDSPERFSTRHDHFEPAMTGRFFAEQKEMLVREGELAHARAEALDERIVGNACALVRRGRSAEARPLLDAVSWDRIEGYDWYTRATFAGIVKLLGPALGPATFYGINRALGRL